MIFFKPITDESKITECFPDVKIAENYVYGGYIGIDNENNSVGQALVRVDGYSCEILSVVCDYSDKLLVEGFIRALLNFAANRMVYIAYTRIENIDEVLLSLGFNKDENSYGGDIPSLLKGSCSNCK